MGEELRLLDWLAEHWLAALLFGAYTLLLLRNAWLGRQVGHNPSGYLVGNRNIGGVVIGISFFATFASTNSYVGNAGKAWEFGLVWLTMGVIMIAMTLLSWSVVAPRLRRFAGAWDAMTLPDLLAARFRSPLLRRASGLIVAASSLLYLMAVFKGSGHLLQSFAAVPYETAIGITLVIVVLYTSVGGFVSVVRTDVLQGVLMIIGSVLLFVLVTSAAGGVTALTELKTRPDTEHLFGLNAGIPFAVLLGIALSGSLKLLVDPRQLARFYGLRDERAVRVGKWVAVGGLALVMFTLLPIGLYARLLLDGVAETDLVVPTLITDRGVIPLWAGDVLVVAMIAAAMSSLDSVLLVAAAVLTRDVLPGERSLAWTRLAVLGFAAVGALLALRPPAGIIEITTFSGSIYAACFMPAVLLGLHWQRGDARSVFASMAAGLVVLLGWAASPWGDAVHEVFPALLVSFAVYALLAWRTPRQAWPDVAG